MSETQITTYYSFQAEEYLAYLLLVRKYSDFSEDQMQSLALLLDCSEEGTKEKECF